MNKIVITAAALLSSVSVWATDVGVSVQISQPGVYGRIDIGRFPQPAVMVQQPVLFAPRPVMVAQPAPVAVQPVYMWVPPGHQKNWRKHCNRYNACGVPVYFVQERWYNDHVMAEGRGDRGNHGRNEHRGKGHDRHRD